MMQQGPSLNQGTDNILNNYDDGAGITPLPAHVAKGIQDVMALFSSQDLFVGQCKKHWTNAKSEALASQQPSHDDDNEMTSDAAVSEKVQGRINAINEAAKAEHCVLMGEEKRKICNLYLQRLQQDLQL